jgi:hypothetical protein
MARVRVSEWYAFFLPSRTILAEVPLTVTVASSLFLFSGLEDQPRIDRKPLAHHTYLYRGLMAFGGGVLCSLQK